MKRMNFEEFIASKKRNAWIYEPGIEIYVRISLPVRGTDYDLASMNAERPGEGALTRFLDRYEGKYKFFIENVHEPSRLGEFFLRRGYFEASSVLQEDYLPRNYSR